MKQYKTNVMNKQEFLNLPATRKGLRLLDEAFKSTDNIFFNEVSRALRTHLQLPTVVKRAVSKFSFAETLEKYEMVKKAGYRTELTLPF